MLGADNLLELPEEQIADDNSSNTLNTSESDPVVYFDFEDDSGTTVKDKSPYNNNGTIEKVNETTIGIDGGAPAGRGDGAVLAGAQEACSSPASSRTTASD